MSANHTAAQSAKRAAVREALNRHKVFVCRPSDSMPMAASARGRSSTIRLTKSMAVNRRFWNVARGRPISFEPLPH